MQIAPNPSTLLISTNKKFVEEIIEITRGNLGSAPKGAKEIAEKLLEIAQLYQVPVSELMSPTEKGIRSGRVIIDVNKLANNPDDSNDAALKIIQRIAQLRHDWNGQVISLRSSDIDLLKIFANYSDEQTNNFLDSFALAKLK